MEPNLSVPPNVRTSAPLASERVTSVPVLTVYPRAVGRVVRNLGFNVEIQTDHDRVNLWDWLADSGAGVVREFHPEVNLRREPVREGAWGAIRSRADFDAKRREYIAGSGPAAGWPNYRFAERIPLLGEPDAILRKIREIGMHPMVPMGYVPRMFPRPLVRDPERLTAPDDDGVDWEAAFSAYEYYFALMHHFSTTHGCWHFMMVNEPEYRSGGFYLPAELEKISADLFQKIFIELEDVGLWRLYFRSLAVQMGVLTSLARQAMEDVRGMLADRALAAKLVLSGPVAGNLDDYWPFVKDHVDICDYHQYSAHPAAYRQRFRRAAALVRGSGRPVVISEFNRQAGEMSVASTYFPIAEALGLADIMMEIIALSGPGDPELLAATLYHFHFPATHRNYKSLVFGDMNRVDWTGRDARPSGVEMEPTVEELQIRHATPAYHLFRMLARHAGTDAASGEPHPVFETSLMVRDTALVYDVNASTRVLASRSGDRMVVSILNLDEVRADAFAVDVAEMGGGYSWAVVRETTQDLSDRVTAEVPVENGRMCVQVPARSLVQVIFSAVDPASITAARIVEQTFTPGTASSLGLYETSRLRLVAKVAGRETDLTGHNIVWTSDDPQFVSVGQGGLLQRVRRTTRTIVVRAALANGTVLAQIPVPPV